MMLMMDPPQHTQFRKIISREFTQGPAAELRPRISELANQILDGVLARGECEFVADVAGELPSYVIAELMGNLWESKNSRDDKRTSRWSDL